MRTAFLPILAAAALITCPSCLIGSDTSTTQSGKFVSDETLATIDTGMSQDDVRAVLGTPTSEVTMSDGAQLWKWAYSVETTKSGGVIFIIGSKKTETKEGTAYVQFDTDGKVTRSWRD